MKLRWLRLLSLGAAVIPAMMAVTILLGSTSLRGVAGILNVAAEVAFLELIIPAAMLNARVLSELPDPEEVIARSVPALAQIGLIKKHVMEYMTTMRPYRNSDLRLSTVAGAVGVPPHVLSSVINREFGLSFTDFVNRYRIREAQKPAAPRALATSKGTGRLSSVADWNKGNRLRAARRSEGTPPYSDLCDDDGST